MRIKTLLGPLFISIFIGCTNSSYKVEEGGISLKVLKEYYETEDLTYNYEGKNIRLNVKNSQLISRERQKQQKWKTNEAFASNGSLILYDEILKNDKSFESIIVDVDDENYKYLISDVKKVSEYRNISDAFFSALSKKELAKAKTLMDVSFTDADKEKVIASILDLGDIVNNKIVAYRLNAGQAQLYISLQLKNGESITLIFIFLLEKDNKKIAGIETAFV